MEQKELPPESYFLYRAFWDLDTCREVGMGMGPIPWTAINEYALRYTLMDRDFEYFRMCIMYMDSTYLKIKKDQAEQERKRQVQKTKGKRWRR